MIRSIIFNYVGMFVTGLTGFILTPVLIHGLGDYHYGMWILVASIVDYYGLADLGIRFTLQRHVARFKGADQREALDQTFVTALAMSLSVAVIIVISTLASVPWLPSIFHVVGSDRALFIRVLLLLGFSFAVALPGKVLGAYLCGLQRFDLYNLVGSGTTLFQALLIIWVLHVGYGILGCAATSLGTSFVALVLYWRLVRVADPEASLDFRKTTWAQLKDLFNFGVYVFVNQIGDLFRFRLDSLVIARWLNISLVTHFNVATRLVEYFRYLTAAIVGPLITEMSTLEGQANDQALKALFLRSTRFTALLTFLMGAMMCVDGKPLLAFWVGNAFISSYSVLLVLAVARTAATMQSPSMVLLLARGRHRALGVWTLLEGVLNLVLSIYWAGKYGIVGVALGTAVPMLLFRLIVQPWYTLSVARVPAWEYVAQSMIRPLVVLGIFAGVVWLVTPALDRRSPLVFVASLVWQIGIYGLLTYWIGLTGSERQRTRERVTGLLSGRQAVSAA